MADKEYKSGTKDYYIGPTGQKQDRKLRDRQNADYKSRTYKRVLLLIRKDDKDVIEKLESVPSKNSYIVDLIRKDIKASK